MAPGRRLGSLTPLGPGKWQARVFLGRDAAGKRQYRAFVLEGTKKQAEDQMLLKYAEFRGVPKTSNGSTPVEVLFRTWLAANQNISESTRGAYTFLWERYLAPVLGARKLSDVTEEMAQDLQDGLKHRWKLKPRSIRRVMSLATSLFREAVRRKMIPHNPLQGLSKPKVAKEPPKCWSPAELRQFLQVTKDTRWGPLWWLLGTSGLRPGEALALEWTDLEKDRIRVTKSLTRTVTGGTTVGPTKTNTMRSVVLPQATVDLLQRHRSRQTSGTKLLFPTRVGTPFQVNNVATIFRQTLEALGMPHVTLYSLRHAHATDLLSRGVNPKIVSERLGHSTVSMTLDTYSHVLPSMQEGMAQELNSSLEDL